MKRLIIILAAVLLTACQFPEAPTLTTVPYITDEPRETVTATGTEEPTATQTVGPSPTSTVTATATATLSPSPAPTVIVPTATAFLNGEFDGGFYYGSPGGEIGAADGWTVFWDSTLKRPETYVMPIQKPGDTDLLGYNQYLAWAIQHPDQGYSIDDHYRGTQKGFSYGAPSVFGVSQVVETVPGSVCTVTADYTTIVGRDPVHWYASDIVDKNTYKNEQNEDITYYPVTQLDYPASRGFIMVDPLAGNNYLLAEPVDELNNVLFIGDPGRAASLGIDELGNLEGTFTATRSFTTVFIGVQFYYGIGQQFGVFDQHVVTNDWLLFSADIHCETGTVPTPEPEPTQTAEPTVEPTVVYPTPTQMVPNVTPGPIDCEALDYSLYTADHRPEWKPIVPSGMKIRSCPVIGSVVGFIPYNNLTAVYGEWLDPSGEVWLLVPYVVNGEVRHGWVAHISQGITYGCWSASCP